MSHEFAVKHEHEGGSSYEISYVRLLQVSLANIEGGSLTANESIHDQDSDWDAKSDDD